MIKSKFLRVFIIVAIIMLALFGYVYFFYRQEPVTLQEEISSFDPAREREFLRSLAPKEPPAFNREKELEFLRSLAPR